MTILAPHTIHSARGAKRSAKRVGRGHGSGRGTMSGRGGKGQRARTGGKSRTHARAFKKVLQKIPKLRGVRSIHEKPGVVTLATLERIASAGDIVTPRYLEDKGVARDSSRGVKILATGLLTKQLTVQGCLASKGAVAAIEKAGGKLVF